jgi:hypothetical protein
MNSGFHHEGGERYALRVITLRVLVPLKMGLIVFPKTSVRNCHFSLHNNPEGGSSYIPCNLKNHSEKCCASYLVPSSLLVCSDIEFLMQFSKTTIF